MFRRSSLARNIMAPPQQLEGRCAASVWVCQTRYAERERIRIAGNTVRQIRTWEVV